MSAESDIAALKADIFRLQEQFRAIPSRWAGGGQLHFVEIGAGNTIGTYGSVTIKGIKYSSSPITSLPSLTPSGTVTDGLGYGSLDTGGQVWVSGYFTPPGGSATQTLSGNFPEGSIVVVLPPIMMPVASSSELRPLYPLFKI